MDVRNVSGFPEWMPAMKLVEQRYLDIIRAEFERFGFTPIETPAVERFEILDAKTGVGRQIYQLTRPEAEAKAPEDALGLHFDLTVPLARYVAQYGQQLQFPFRRYQIQKVWRGERAQRGRFREFYQCDIDVVGRDSLDVLYDAEAPCILASIFQRLELPDFKVHISNRKVLSDLFAAFGFPDAEATILLRVVDRYHKIGPASVAEDLVAHGLSPAQADTVIELVNLASTEEARKLCADAGAATHGLDELDTVMAGAVQLGMPPATLQLDLSIARGLDYYTGTVFETFVVGKDSWGSICSGGRYDDLAAQFGSKTSYPGIGISIGLSRLLDLLRLEGLITEGPATVSSVMIAVTDRDHLAEYLEFARVLRAAGIATEVHFQPARLNKQLASASKKGIPCVVIAGEDEFSRSEVVVRDMRDRTQQSVAADQLTEVVSARLQADPSPGAPSSDG